MIKLIGFLFLAALVECVLLVAQAAANGATVVAAMFAVFGVMTAAAGCLFALNCEG